MFTNESEIIQPESFDRKADEIGRNDFAGNSYTGDEYW
jgi:hypothetical protein